MDPRPLCDHRAGRSPQHQTKPYLLQDHKVLFLLAEGQRGEQDACLAQLVGLSLQFIIWATLWRRVPRSIVGGRHASQAPWSLLLHGLIPLSFPLPLLTYLQNQELLLQLDMQSGPQHWVDVEDEGRW